MVGNTVFVRRGSARTTKIKHNDEVRACQNYAPLTKGQATHTGKDLEYAQTWRQVPAIRPLPRIFGSCD